MAERTCKRALWSNDLNSESIKLTTVGKRYEVIRTDEFKQDIVIDDKGNEQKVGKYSAWFETRD